MNALALRQVDDNLFQQLKTEAQNRKTSVNKLVLSLLREALSQSHTSPADQAAIEAQAQRARDERNQWILSLGPAWTDDQLAEFNTAIAPLTQIDKQMWD